MLEHKTVERLRTTFVRGKYQHSSTGCQFCYWRGLMSSVFTYTAYQCFLYALFAVLLLSFVNNDISLFGLKLTVQCHHSLSFDMSSRSPQTWLNHPWNVRKWENQSESAFLACCHQCSHQKFAERVHNEIHRGQKPCEALPSQVFEVVAKNNRRVKGLAKGTFCF